MRAAIVCSVVFTVAISTDALAQCTKDIDCKGNRICERGRCVTPAQAAAAAPPASHVAPPPPVPFPPYAPATQPAAPAPVAPAPLASAPAVAPVPAVAKAGGPAPRRTWFKAYGSISNTLGVTGWGGFRRSYEGQYTNVDMTPGLWTGIRLSGLVVASRAFHIGGLFRYSSGSVTTKEEGYDSSEADASEFGFGVTMKFGGQVGRRVYLSGALDLAYYRFTPDEDDDSYHGMELFPRFQVDVMVGTGSFKWSLFGAMGPQVIPFAMRSYDVLGSTVTDRVWLSRFMLVFGASFGG